MLFGLKATLCLFDSHCWQQRNVEWGDGPAPASHRQHHPDHPRPGLADRHPATARLPPPPALLLARQGLSRAATGAVRRRRDDVLPGTTPHAGVEDAFPAAPSRHASLDAVLPPRWTPAMGQPLRPGTPLDVRRRQGAEHSAHAPSRACVGGAHEARDHDDDSLDGEATSARNEDDRWLRHPGTRRAACGRAGALLCVFLDAER